MIAIRWFNTKYLQCNPTHYSWFVQQELNGRQRSMEFLPQELDVCWANPECVGLLLDMDNTIFHRGYCKDSYTFVDEDGERVSEAIVKSQKQMESFGVPNGKMRLKSFGVFHWKSVSHGRKVLCPMLNIWVSLYWQSRHRRSWKSCVQSLA